MDKVVKYRELRKIQTELYNKIIDFAEAKYYNEVLLAAEKLDLKIRERKLELKKDNEYPFLMDYFLHEHKIKGKTISEMYFEKFGAANEREEEILNQMNSTYASLYRIVNVSREKYLVFLMDALNNVRNTRLTDISFSETIEPDKLIYTRVLKVDGISMSSGMSFIFEDKNEEQILDAVNTIKNSGYKEDETILEIFNIMKRADDQFGIQAIMV